MSHCSTDLMAVVTNQDMLQYTNKEREENHKVVNVNVTNLDLKYLFYKEGKCTRH